MNKRKMLAAFLFSWGIILLWSGMVWAIESSTNVQYGGIAVALCGLILVLLAALTYESDPNE